MASWENRGEMRSWLGAHKEVDAGGVAWFEGWGLGWASSASRHLSDAFGGETYIGDIAPPGRRLPAVRVKGVQDLFASQVIFGHDVPHDAGSATADSLGERSSHNVADPMCNPALARWLRGE